MPSVSQKQHNLMAMVANDPAKAKQLGVPQSVGKEFVQADKGLKFGKGSKTRADLQKINRPDTKQGKSELFSKGGHMANTSRMNRLEELGRVDAEKARTSAGKKNLAAEKKRIVGEMTMKKGGKAYASGGLAAGHKSADGIAKKGKTRAMKPTMSGGKPLGMKRGGACK